MNHCQEFNDLSDSKQIQVLKQRIDDMQEYSDLGRARKSSYRDQVERHRDWCLNVLNEDVLVDLKLCLHAIDRPQPKMDVSICRVEVTIERVMAVIEKLNEDK